MIKTAKISTVYEEAEYPWAVLLGAVTGYSLLAFQYYWTLMAVVAGISLVSMYKKFDTRNWYAITNGYLLGLIAGVAFYLIVVCIEMIALGLTVWLAAAAVLDFCEKNPVE